LGTGEITVDKEKIGLDEEQLGDRFEGKLASTMRQDPQHVVICTKKSTPTVFKAAQIYFEDGVGVTLIRDRQDAPAGTRWSA
jgi:hypothetical protein